VAEPKVLEAAARVRELLGTYRDASDLIQVGAYAPGSDPRVDHAVRSLPKIEAFLRQPVDERASAEDTRKALLSLGVAAPPAPQPGPRR
jgi:flagellar biosynthesis/type III secretory pathway ATPase